jgi:hypothetical protein
MQEDSIKELLVGLALGRAALVEVAAAILVAPGTAA